MRIRTRYPADKRSPAEAPAASSPAAQAVLALGAGVVGGVYGIGGGSLLGPILAARGLPLALIAPATLAATTFTTSIAAAAVYTALAPASAGPSPPTDGPARPAAPAVSAAATSAPGSSRSYPRRHCDPCSALSPPPSEPSTKPRRCADRVCAVFRRRQGCSAR
ncbi:TSUP family transporter [Streptomyces sp. NPDC047042]|uniref:TSUP family transporter n=1 Tax=Streptomyces sp. NPDC047042 TaxID=3154807 RepID=UPI0033DE13E0